MAESRRESNCRECRTGLPHCHGTLIRHAGQSWQCTEHDCPDAEVLLHSLRLDCEVLCCECGQRPGHRLAV